MTWFESKTLKFTRISREEFNNLKGKSRKLTKEEEKEFEAIHKKMTDELDRMGEAMDEMSKWIDKLK